MIALKLKLTDKKNAKKVSYVEETLRIQDMTDFVNSIGRKYIIDIESLKPIGSIQ